MLATNSNKNNVWGQIQHVNMGWSWWVERRQELTAGHGTRVE